MRLHPQLHPVSPSAAACPLFFFLLLCDMSIAALCAPVIRRWCWLIVFLAGCATAPAPQLYTLMPDSTAIATAPQSARVLVQVAPVRVPEALDRTDVLITHSAVQVQRLPHALWRSPYAEEVQDAVLAGILSNGGIARLPRGTSAQKGILPAFELHLAVDRMDIAPQRLARLDVTWALYPLLSAGRAGGAERTKRPHAAASDPAAGIVCRAQWQMALADADIASAIAAQQQLVQRWAQRIERQLLQAVAAQGALGCGADTAHAAHTV